MPTFECTTAVTVDYQMDGPDAPTVQGRAFEVGERVSAAANPDPNSFTEIGD